MKVTTLNTLAIVCILSAGCVHSKRVYIRVVDENSKAGLAEAQLRASVYDPLHPSSRRTRIRQALTGSDGLAVIRIPMCRTHGVDGGCFYLEGRCLRGDPGDQVGPELIVAKEGYDTYITYRSNNDWKGRVWDNSQESPFVVHLTRTCTDPDFEMNPLSDE